MTGVSVRVAYGFNRYLAVEAEFAGASSGTARFASMTYQDTLGELTRSASPGRVQLGGLLQLGETYIPTMRFGVGRMDSASAP